MRFDSRNLIIAIMFLIIIALMGLVYKVNKLVVDRIPENIEPEVYVMGLTEAIDRQNRAVYEMAYQNRWLRIHLDNCLRLIESERNLESIPVEFDMSKDPFIGMPFEGDRQGPFVRPYAYAPPEVTNDQEEHIRVLHCKVNLATMGSFTDRGAEEILANFQHRPRP